MRPDAALPVVLLLLTFVQPVTSLDPRDSSDALSDSDRDGLVNAEEFRHGTDPLDPDTDRAGAPDGWEAYCDAHRAVFPKDSPWALFDADGDRTKESAVPPSCRFDPANPDDEQEDADDDALCNLAEYRIGTDPTNPDTDGDGTIDSREEPELIGCGTHPLEAPGDETGTAIQGVGLAPLLAICWDAYFARAT